MHILQLNTRACSTLIALALGGCSLDLDALREAQTEADARPFTELPDDAATPADDSLKSQPSAGSSAQASAAGMANAGAAADTGPTCGVLGESCCRPDNRCDEGSCLRGRCTTYGGVYANLKQCDTESCTSRNAYSAGCRCPEGFTVTSFEIVADATGSCGSAGTLEVGVCTAQQSAQDASLAGMWLASMQPTCNSPCVAPDALTGSCSCEPGQDTLALPVRSTSPTCSGGPATLGLCMGSEHRDPSFGGVYVMSDGSNGRCELPNPMTSACSCGSSATEQQIELGGFHAVVCNL